MVKWQTGRRGSHVMILKRTVVFVGCGVDLVPCAHCPSKGRDDCRSIQAQRASPVYKGPLHTKY